MKLTNLLALLIGVSTPLAIASSDDPDPQQVLNEAGTLARQGKFEEALQKHLWYHQNALRIAPSQSAVRLSFALSSWVELGASYPKARETLIGIRDDDVRKFEGQGTFPLFHEIAAINGYLGEQAKTVELFKATQIKNPDLAKLCYYFAEEDLVAAREFAICGDFLTNPSERLARQATAREVRAKVSSNRDANFAKMADEAFAKKVRSLIEILVGSGRKPEAEAVQTQALAILDTPSIRSAVADAERGPKPLDGAEAAILEVIEQYAKAHEFPEAKAIGALFTADVDQLVTGRVWQRGREALVEAIFESSRKSRAQRIMSVGTVRFLAADVALADLRDQLAAEPANVDRDIWTSITLKRGPDGWKIASIRTMLLAPPPVR